MLHPWLLFYYVCFSEQLIILFQTQSGSSCGKQNKNQTVFFLHNKLLFHCISVYSPKCSFTNYQDRLLETAAPVIKERKPKQTIFCVHEKLVFPRFYILPRCQKTPPLHQSFVHLFLHSVPAAATFSLFHASPTQSFHMLVVTCISSILSVILHSNAACSTGSSTPISHPVFHRLPIPTPSQNRKHYFLTWYGVTCMVKSCTTPFIHAIGKNNTCRSLHQRHRGSIIEGTEMKKLQRQVYTKVNIRISVLCANLILTLSSQIG